MALIGVFVFLGEGVVAARIVLFCLFEPVIRGVGLCFKGSFTMLVLIEMMGGGRHDQTKEGEKGEIKNNTK